MTRWRLDGVATEVGHFRVGPVDLEIGGVGAVAVLGPSGAGKTTLLRALAGVGPVTSGRLEADGVDLGASPPEQRRVGYVPQGLALFPHRTVRANVSYPLRLRTPPRPDAEADPLLERFGLEALADRRPPSLSTGEQERVAIARALAAEPRLLLWDEPLTALDRPARDALLDVFREVRERSRLPLVFVTHDPTIAFSIADDALVLDRGQVEYAGPVERLLDRPTSPFAARFAGYENVLGPSALTGTGEGLGTLLARHAGPGGLCFRAPTARPPADRGAFGATVERVEPSLGGFLYTATVGPGRVRLRSDRGQRWRAGDPVTFDLAETDLVTIPRAVGEPR